MNRAESGNKSPLGRALEITKLERSNNPSKDSDVESQPQVEAKEESFRVPPMNKDSDLTCTTCQASSSLSLPAVVERPMQDKRVDISIRLNKCASARSLGSASSAGSSTSEADDPITEASLQKFAILALIMQALLAAGSMWHTILISNPMVITSVFVTFQLWFLLLCWKLTLLHPSHHSLVYVSSVLIAFCCAVAPMVLQIGLFWWFSAPFVISLALWVGTLRLTKECLRKTNTTEELHDLAITTIGSSLKAGIVLVYFQAESLGAIDGESSNELLEAVFCFDWYEGRIWDDDFVLHICDGALSNNQEDQRMAHQEYQEPAEQVGDYLRATVSGCTINMSVYLWLVFLHVLHLSLNNILALQVTVSEVILLVASLLLVALCLIFQSTPNVLLVAADDLLLTVAVFTILISSVYLVRMVVKDMHPYCQSRLEAKRRGQSRLDEQIPFASSDEGPA